MYVCMYDVYISWTTEILDFLLSQDHSALPPYLANFSLWGKTKKRLAAFFTLNFRKISPHFSKVEGCIS